MVKTETLDLTFKIILICLYSIFTIIRLNISRIIRKAKIESQVKEKKFSLSFLQIYILITVILFFLYIFLPQWFNWSKIPNYPRAVQWVGFSLGIVAIALFIYVHIHLGKNFSYKIAIKEDHKLIKTGPYKLIRHPMYTAFIILHSAVFLLTGNWFLGIIWVVGIFLVIALRIKQEEKMLIEEFGDEYKEYIKTTGALFPNIFKFIMNDKPEKSIEHD
jgi:protein-S-isoprenylcysteine O-methyltransferase Ste14